MYNIHLDILLMVLFSAVTQISNRCYQPLTMSSTLEVSLQIYFPY